MALSTLKPTTRYVSILIATVEYRELFDRMSIRSTAPVLNETVFSNENQSGENSVGSEQLTISFGQLLKKGTTAAHPFLPISSYQGKALVATFDNGCFVSATINLIDTNPNAVAGGSARNETVWQNTGAFAVGWHYS
jgi:hypothetical protein